MTSTSSHTKHVNAVKADGGAPDRNGRRKSLWVRQRDALVRGAYRALNCGCLQLADLSSFLESNVTAPIAGCEYDRVMGGDPNPRGKVTPEALERLLESAETKVRAGYSRERYSAVQRRRARCRWEGKVHTVADLEHVRGMSIRESAQVLGCSTATVKRLRAKAAGSSMALIHPAGPNDA